MKLTALVFLFMSLSLQASLAAEKATKGLLPEIRLNSGDESENDKKAFSSEMMITRTENKAISTLQALLKKKKGTQEEADLWYRLAELYMRRSKSGRFFDLHQDTPLLRLSPFPVPNEKGEEAVRRASKIYTKIEQEFPRFPQMDSVLFNNAFAFQQLKNHQQSERLYARLLAQFPNSPLIADGTLALAELLYDQGKFLTCLEQLQKIANMPNSRVYSYGMYKAAWAYYNLRDSENATKKLVQVIKHNPPQREGATPNQRQNLRREALRDLTVFLADSFTANKIFTFFESITNEEELGQAMVDLAKLYDSYSRQKEMITFLSEYLEKRPLGLHTVQVHLFLVEAYETLKNRDKVVYHLELASNLCKTDSTWRSSQDEAVIAESCVQGFHHTSLEMAKKWWEIFLKNKQNKTFAELTIKLLQLVLENEDSTKPELNTRYAYAELLFQIEKYEEASTQYKIVGDKASEPSLRHDADYAALFAKEKSLEKNTDPLKEAERKLLAKNYVQRNPAGKYQNSVKFKLAHIAYEEKDYSEAEKSLRPLAKISGEDNLEIRKKAEDLLLDILNLRRDFAGIKDLSNQIRSNTLDDVRKQSMTKIQTEAHFNEIQEFAKGGDKTQTVQKLLSFSDAHDAQSKLSQEAQWQALGLLYETDNPFEAASLSLKYVAKYPNDKKNLDALKDAAKAYADVGQLTKSAETIVQMAETDKPRRNTHLELAADMYLLEKNTPEARNIYREILQSADEKTTSRIYGKLLDSFKSNSSSKEYEKIEGQILAKGIEPFTTQIIIRRAKNLYSEGKATEAFDLSMKANGRDTSSEVRAEARLLQAQILEDELVRQSVKAREEKFAMVLALKTEKLDKAHTAYFSTLKMSKDPAQQLEAMRGIDRCYHNFVESLTSMPLPLGLSAEEQSTIRAEIAKITQPIENKRQDNATNMAKLSSTLGGSSDINKRFANLSLEESVPPVVQYPELEKLPPSLPKATKPDIHLERQGLELAKSKDQRGQGLYLASLGAEGRGLQQKALWLINSALKTQPDSSSYLYQKARLLYSTEGLGTAMPTFEKALELKSVSTELQTFAGVKAYAEKNYETVIKIFSALTKEQLYNYKVGPMLSESYAQKGEVDKGLRIVRDLLNINGENTDLLLQEAHILESFKGSISLALGAYEKALKASRQKDLHNWLEKKIEHLKIQNKVVQNVISGDL